jgi:hypothetical protein
MSNEATVFLDMLFGDLEGGYFMLFGLPSKSTSYFRKVDNGAAIALAMSKHDNTYVGCGFYSHATKSRQKDEDVAGITSFWADVDIAGPAHKASGLPTDRASALAVLKAHAIPQPTMAIDSGHGLHLWWCFNEPLEFLGADHRGETRDRLAGFQATLRAIYGGVLDSTHDMARILRVPGTMNRKKDCEPVPVKTMFIAENARYEIADFDNFIVNAEDLVAGKPATPVQTKEVEQWPVQVEDGREWPVGKVAAFQTADDKFALTWGRKRSDFKDQSQSSYDLSLANQMVAAGWVDQEIVDTLIQHRKMGGHPPKTRKDYFYRTLRRAREDSEVERAQTYVGEYEGGSEPSQDARAEIFDALKTALGVNITKVTKYLSDPDPTYELEIDGNSIPLGKIEGLINQTQFKSKVAALSNQIIKNLNTKGWRNVSQMLLDVREDVEVGVEATEMGAFDEQMASYLEAKKPAKSIKDQGVVGLKQPFYDDDGVTVCIFAADVRGYILRTYREKVSPQAFGRLLRKAGYTDAVVGVTVNDSNTTRTIWRRSEWRRSEK